MNNSKMLEQQPVGLAKRSELIHAELEKRLSLALEQAALENPLSEAVCHAVFPGGKRIRPMFALLLCDDLGGDTEALLDAVVSIELVHCATLVHDDLPSLDNDAIRRGRPSCHVAFGEATAVLVGDFLSSYANYLLSRLDRAPQQIVHLAGGLSKAYSDIAHGQQLDLLGDRPTALVHLLKTATLFELAAYFAAQYTEIDRKDESLTKKLGLDLGLFFQGADDFLDIHGVLEVQGRPSGSDKRNQRNTFFKDSAGHGLKELTLARKSFEATLTNLENSISRGDFLGVRSIANMIYSRLDEKKVKPFAN